MASLDFMLRVALIPRGVINHDEDKPSCIQSESTRFVADWLKSKGLHKLCSVFEGIQEPFILSLACKSVVSFRSIIKATEEFPGGGGI